MSRARRMAQTMIRVDGGYDEIERDTEYDQSTDRMDGGAYCPDGIAGGNG